MFFICHYSGILNTITQVKLEASSLKVYVLILSLRQETRKKKGGGNVERCVKTLGLVFM